MGFQKGITFMEIIRHVHINRRRTEITFESGWKVLLPDSIRPDFSLTEGTEVDRSSFEKFLLLHQYPGALNKAVAMLAARPRSEAEIQSGLSCAGYDDSVTELVLLKLKQENLLDDHAFAEQWAQSRIRKYGSSRIRNELRMKGVDPELAHAAAESCSDEDQLTAAAAIAEKKLRSISNQELSRADAFRKVSAMLQRRGYSWSIIKKAFETVWDGNEVI